MTLNSIQTTEVKIQHEQIYVADLLGSDQPAYYIILQRKQKYLTMR